MLPIIPARYAVATAEESEALTMEVEAPMLTRHYKALERVFGAEINGKLPLQSRAKVYEELEQMQLVQRDSREFGFGPFAVTVKGWCLTELGRLAYCVECSPEEAHAKR